MKTVRELVLKPSVEYNVSKTRQYGQVYSLELNLQKILLPVKSYLGSFDESVCASEG